MKNYLSIDQGTTSSRSIIFNSNLEKQIDSQLEYKLDYPDDGWVELHPDDVVNTVKKTIANVLDNFNGSIEACGITNQRETTIVWSRDTGEPIYPGIVWQDRRTNEYCQELNYQEDIYIFDKSKLKNLNNYWPTTIVLSWNITFSRFGISSR